MTPEQAAELPANSPPKTNWLLSASVKEIVLYVHALSRKGFLTAVDLELAKVAIEFRVAEDAAKSAENLKGETNRLVGEVVALAVISEEQKRYAIKLDRQTKWLIRLTWVLALFTVGVFVVAVAQTKIMLKQDTQAHIEPVSTRQTNQTPTTNQQKPVPAGQDGSN